MMMMMMMDDRHWLDSTTHSSSLPSTGQVEQEKVTALAALEASEKESERLEAEIRRMDGQMAEIQKGG